MEFLTAIGVLIAAITVSLHLGDQRVVLYCEYSGSGFSLSSFFLSVENKGKHLGATTFYPIYKERLAMGPDGEKRIYKGSSISYSAMPQGKTFNIPTKEDWSMMYPYGILVEYCIWFIPRKKFFKAIQKGYFHVEN